MKKSLKLQIIIDYARVLLETGTDQNKIPRMAVAFANAVEHEFEESLREDMKPVSIKRKDLASHYYYVSAIGTVVRACETHLNVDDSLYNVGNYFYTEEEAERVAKYVRQAFNKYRDDNI